MIRARQQRSDETNYALWAEWALLTIGRGLAALLSAVIFIIASRHSVRSSFGLVVSVTSAATFAAVLVDLGLSATILRGGGVHPGDAHWFRAALLRRGFVCATAVLVACGIAAFRNSLQFFPLSSPVVFASCLLAVACSLAFEAIVVSCLVGMHRSRLSAVTLVLDRVLSLAVLLVMGPRWNWASALLVSQVVGPLMAVVVLYRVAGDVVSTSARVHDTLRTRFGFVQTSGAVQLQNLEVPLVASIAGSVQGAYIGLGSRLTGPLTLVANVGSSLVLRSGSSTTERLSRRQQLLVGVLPGFPLAVAACLPRGVLSAVVGSMYGHAIPVLRLVLLATAVNCCIQPLVAGLQQAGHVRFVGNAVACCVALGLASCAIGASVDGATGGAFGMLACQVVQTSVFVTKSFGPADGAKGELG